MINIFTLIDKSDPDRKDRKPHAAGDPNPQSHWESC